MVSRLDNFANDSSGTTKYAQYGYFGAGSIYKVEHPAVNSGGGLTLNYDIDGDHTYAGLDRFGRVVNQKWSDASGSNTLDQFLYGYDKAGSRTYRLNVVAAAAGKSLDELYTYDNLDRLKTADRGVLNTNRDALSTTAFKQNWGLDKLGNWATFKQDDTGGGTWTLDQSREHNKVNEISSITGGGNWIQPVHDAAGNMTEAPSALNATVKHKLIYDAWNRLMEVRDASNALIATYRYNGLNWRVRVIVNSGGTTDYYYNEYWQVVEEQRTSGTSTSTYAQYLWDQRYIDAPVCRWRDADSNTTNGLEENLYYCTDANMNVTALVNGATGGVVERYHYTPYGQATVLDSSFSSQLSTLYRNCVLYCGYRFDPETGLYQVRYRMYHPTLGRWINRDPIGYIDDINQYNYVHGRSTLIYDPFGLGGAALVVNASLEGGGCIVGAGGNVGVGMGGFYDYGSGSFSTDMFAQEGLAAGTPTGSVQTAPGHPQPTVIGGAYAGIGAGVMITNADNAKQLSGPFYQFNLNLPVISGNFAIDPASGIWEFSITVGIGVGASGSAYTTTTHVLEKQEPKKTVIKDPSMLPIGDGLYYHDVSRAFGGP